MVKVFSFRTGRARGEASAAGRDDGSSGSMSATLELACADARVVLAPGIGGAIAAFRCGGVDVLRPSAAAALAAGDVRGLACYPLVPYSNRIADAILHFAGQRYVLARNFGDHPHAIHGVGWQRPWTVVDAAPDRAMLGFAHRPDTDDARAAWPCPFDATHAMHVTGNGNATTLFATLTIRS